MKNDLQISDDLSLPIDAVTQKLAALGRTGSGKSYFATKLAETMLDAGAQIVALDPVGIWYGLRTAYSIPVFGGLHGDIPLEVGGGALIADLIVDRRISAVVDVSQFESDADKARFARDFAARFFFRQKGSPSAVHLFVEEAQEFIPQNPEREEGKMLHAFVRIAKLGRNFGIGATLISQRPQEVSKKALNQTECLFAFQMTGPQERKTIQDWISQKGVDEDLREILPSLKVGEAHIWSPQWLQISKTIRIAKKKTADVSSTPKHGAKALRSKDLRPVDLDALREKMAATIEKAKADDPRELRAKIASLERDLRAADAAAQATSVLAAAKTAKPKIVEVQVVKAAQVAKLDGVADKLQETAQKAQEMAGLIVAALRTAKTPETARLVLERGTAAVRPSPVASPIPVAKSTATPKPPKTPKTDFRIDDAPLSGPQTKILNTLASFEDLGVLESEKSQIALFSGASPTSSSFANNLSALRTAGLIDYPGGGRVQLTTSGRAVAISETVFATVEDLQATWIAKVGGACGKILRALIAEFPQALSKEQLAAAVGASPTSSSFANNLSTLRTLGVVDYPARGSVAATPLLFPPQ